MTGHISSVQIILSLLLSCQLLTSAAQQRYWLANEDTVKLGNLPRPSVCSEWLNSCTYKLDSTLILELNEKGVAIQAVQRFQAKRNSTAIPTLGYALEQIEAKAFLNKGLNGAGVKIGIIDGGFLDADENPLLEDFFKLGLVKFYKDYITPDMEPYDGSRSLDDGHGTEVWQQIGGYDKEKDILFGLATRSSIYLARTDHGAFEKRQEEDLLIQALEDQYSKGVRLVNISLGYNVEFTDPSQNYEPHQMDGKTSAIARAVEIAAVEKGMLIVVAAGNEADTPWQTLSTPADAQHSLAVGSSKFSLLDKMNYSSIGPAYTDFVKPDVTVYSSLGTSFSAPVITGMAACIWQYDTTLTSLEIIELFHQAGNFYPYPNNYVGYGVPSCEKILQLIDGKSPELPHVIKTSRRKVKIKNDFDSRIIVAYHKEGKKNVISRDYHRPSGKKFKLKQQENATSTTLLTGSNIIEIIWK